METSQETLDRLQDEVEQLRASRLRLVLAGDAERRSIERALHDGLQQRLVSLSVSLQLGRDRLNTDPEQASALLEEIAGEVQHAIDETASLAQRIYPPQLEAGGLGAALRAAAVAAGVRASIEVDVGADVPPEVAGAAYFCCVEALQSAGQGARAAVDVRVDGGAVVLEIAGRGVAVPESRGARCARDAVEALGGRLTVDSGPGEETRLRGWVPLAR